MRRNMENGSSQGRPATVGLPATARGAASSRAADEPTLRELGIAIVAGRWGILFTMAAIVALAVAYLVVAPPVYRSTALIQIEDPSNTIARLENLSPLFDQKNPVLQKTPLEGEIAVIRSRMILGEVVDKLGLEVFAEPRRLPLVGDAVARRYRGSGPAPALLGLPRYAWGGERIAVSHLVVSDDLLDARLTLTALGARKYALADPEGKPLLQGAVGVPASTGGAGSHVEVLVSQLEARPGTEFTLRRLRSQDVVEALQEDLRVEERPKNSSAVEIELEGRDPVRIASIVGTISSAYLRQNVERRSAEAAKTLEYLESQLPRAKASVESAEASLQAFRSREQTIDLPLEAKASVERLADLDKQLADLRAELAQSVQRYGDQHPGRIELERKIDAVRNERAALVPRAHAQPRKELGTARLVRDVNVATELYLLLLKQAQALRVVQSGMIGSVRLVDRPVVAHHPVRPKPAPVLVLAVLLGLGSGLALTMARRAFMEGASDPQDIEAVTGLPVFATIPHSSREAQLGRRGPRRALLAVAAPDDATTENIRALRTALGFSLKGRGNLVALTSPSPGVGKSFLCTNLAHLFAAAGKRVLVVDADLRCGAVHQSFSLEAQPGLSEVLRAEVALEHAVRRTEVGQLDVLPCGRAAEHPAELLASPRLAEVLGTLSRQYDVVLVDTPPALAVTDPVLVARCASTTLFVLRARQHTLREISLALERFEQSGIPVQGAILNDAQPTGSGYARSYEHRSSARMSAAGALR